MIAGVPVVHGLTGAANSEFKVRNSLAEALATVERFRPTVLWGVPSFIRRFLDEACRRSADFSAVRLVLTSGEPVPTTLRAALRDHLARLGAARGANPRPLRLHRDAGGTGAVPRRPRCRTSFPTSTILRWSSPRPAAGSRRARARARHHPSPPPRHRAHTLSVGDIVTLSRAPCPHRGRAGERVVAMLRRTGNLVKCRGMLVNTDVILDTLSAIADIAEFQVVFAPAPASGKWSGS